MREILWNASDVQKATNGMLVGPTDWHASGVCIDTRKLQKGDLFIALKGPNFDGHSYLDQAMAAGAVACLISEETPTEQLPSTGAYIKVQNTDAALQALGKAGRDRLTCPVIGVTGSVGKTGTKEALKHCLSQQGKCAATLGNLNNHYGVPLTLANIPADCDSVIIEMGMNHPEEIRPLAKLARPDVALITTIAPVHIEFFDSEKEIARAKAEMFDGITPNGHILLNHDNKWYPFLHELAEQSDASTIHSFGANQESDIQLLDINFMPHGSDVKISLFGREIFYHMNLPGSHHVLNSLAVLGAIDLIGKDAAQAAKDLSTLNAVKGRGEKELIPLTQKGMPDRIFTLIDESYNASPISMCAAFQVLEQTRVGQGGRHIAILGDMLELGSNAPNYHKDLAEELCKTSVDLVFCCGKMMFHLYESLPERLKSGYAPSSEKLSEIVLQAVQPGDVLMVKGSLGSKMGLIVDRLKALSEKTLPTTSAGDMIDAI